MNICNFIINYNYIIKNNSIMGIGDWGLGIGDWGLGIGDWAQSPIPIITVIKINNVLKI
jgi:hypothetical protein